MTDDLQNIPADLLKDGYCIMKVASGTSMLPTIPQTAVLKIESTLSRCVRLGDIIYFHTANGYTKIHRVSRLFNKNGVRYLQAWGDNCQFPDAPVDLSHVDGVIVAYEDNGSWHEIDSRIVRYLYLFLSRYYWYYLRIFLKRIKSLVTHYSSANDKDV